MDIHLLPERLRKMLSPIGFQELFWEELQKARKENHKARRIDVFDELNEEYRRYTGMRRYIDYDTFSAMMRRK